MALHTSNPPTATTPLLNGGPKYRDCRDNALVVDALVASLVAVVSQARLGGLVKPPPATGKARAEPETPELPPKWKEMMSDVGKVTAVVFMETSGDPDPTGELRLVDPMLLVTSKWPEKESKQLKVTYRLAKITLPTISAKDASRTFAGWHATQVGLPGANAELVGASLRRLFQNISSSRNLEFQGGACCAIALRDGVPRSEFRFTIPNSRAFFGLWEIEGYCEIPKFQIPVSETFLVDLGTRILKGLGIQIPSYKI